MALRQVVENGDAVARLPQLAHGVDPQDAMARLRARLVRIPNVLPDPAPSVEILTFTALGPVLAAAVLSVPLLSLTERRGGSDWAVLAGLAAEFRRHGGVLVEGVRVRGVVKSDSPDAKSESLALGAARDARSARPQAEPMTRHAASSRMTRPVALCDPARPAIVIWN